MTQLSTPRVSTPGPRVSAALLRLALSLHALAAAAQPVFMGAYLDGDFDRLAWHQLVGSLLPAAALLALVAAVGYAVAGRGRWEPTAALVGLFLLEGFQIGMGYARVLTMHLPLGVLIVAGSIGLAAWSFSAAAGRPRAGRRS